METHIMSPAAQVIVALVPIVGIAIGGIIVFFYLLWHHHEIKLQIKMNIYNPRIFDLKTFSLLVGTLLLAVGFILTIIFALVDGISYALLGGLIPLVIGIAFIIFNKINPDFHNNKKLNEKN